MADDPFALPQAKSAPPSPLEILKREAEEQQKKTKSIGETLRQFAALPAEGVNALLGAPQRVIASDIGNFSKNPRGVAGATAVHTGLAPLALLDPATRKQVGNEVYAAFHPNDPSINANAEAAVGANKIKTADPRFRGKLQNFVVDTVFQTLTDPLTFASLGTAPAGEAALRWLGALGTKALRSPHKLISSTAGNLLTNVAERQGGESAEDIARINSVKQAEITRSRVKHSNDALLLAKNRTLLKKGIMPEDVQQRLLQESYVDGTPQMREQALEFGYRPTKAEQAKPPRGLVDYPLRENYDPHTGEFKTPNNFDNLLLGEEEELRPPTAGFEHRQDGSADPGTLYDRVERRLAQGRAVVRHRATVEGLQQKAGLSPEMAAATATDKKIGGFEIAKALSRAQVDALLSTGIPHMRNVGVGGYLSLGEGGMTNAMRYFITGVPEALTKRLEEGGASHFGVRVPGQFSPARLLPPVVRKASTGMLDKWDQALRAARLEQIDKEMKGADELVKLDRVNQDLGAYNLKPQYVKFLQAYAGANFPQWHNYIVPTMVARGVLRRPDRVERLARTEQNANDSFLPNAPFRVTLGGAVDEAASAAADPARMAFGETPGKRYPSYFGGPSSVGPLSTIAKSVLYGPSKEVPQFLSGLVPFGGVALDVLSNPFKSPLPPAARAAAGISGIYTQKRTPGSMARTAPAASNNSAPAGDPNDPFSLHGGSSIGAPPESDPFALPKASP